MAVPAALERELDAIEKQYAKAADPAAATPPTADAPPAAPGVPATPPADETPPATDDGHGLGAATPNEPPATPPASETPPPTEDMAERLRLSEERYKALKGKFDKISRADDLIKLVDQIRGLTEQNSKLQDAITRLSVTPTTAPAAPAAPDARGKVKTVLGADLGDAGIDAVDELARQRAAEALAPFRAELDQFKAATHATAQDRFFSALDGAFPPSAPGQPATWEAVANDPELHQFLAEKAPFTGKTFNEIVDEARASLDSGRAIAVYQEFFNRRKAMAAPAAPAPKRTPDALIAPGPSASTPPPAGEPPKPRYKRSAIDAFFSPKNSARMSQADFDKMSAVYAVAAAEGRVDEGV